MWVENKGWMGVRADFHFGPSAYVKMLSLSPSQVLPLQMPELSVRGGLRGGWVWGEWGGVKEGQEGGSLERFPF